MPEHEQPGGDTDRWLGIQIPNHANRRKVLRDPWLPFK